MDAIESLNAIYEYVNRYGDSNIIRVSNHFYSEFIEWEMRRSKQIANARELGDQLVKKYITNKEQAA